MTWRELRDRITKEIESDPLSVGYMDQPVSTMPDPAWGTFIVEGLDDADDQGDPPTLILRKVA